VHKPFFIRAFVPIEK